MKRLQLGDPVDVCIPTGNFGNILAAYYAKLVRQSMGVELIVISSVGVFEQLGVPTRRLLCASNQNNILTDFLMVGSSFRPTARPYPPPWPRQAP